MTQIIKKIRRAEKSRPGIRTNRARLLSKIVLLVFTAIAIATAIMMFAGYQAPGAAWVYSPKG